MSLLPYVYVPPDTEDSPLVVSVPHAGVRIPVEDRELIVADERTMLSDVDLLVDRLYKRTPLLGGHLVAATVSRYVLDLNRGPEDVDARVCPEHPSPASENPRALIWRLSTDGQPVQARPLTKAELDSRIQRVHRPYHDRLQAILSERKERFGYAVLLEAHSMPSVGRETHTDPGQRRADVVPGDDNGKSCAPSLRDLIVGHFEGHGLSVSMNKPYSGGWNTRHYGDPANGVHAIQVELNRALYLEEEAAFWAGAPALELQRILDELVTKLVGWKP